MDLGLRYFERGAYDAKRAAALSGVPLSTVYECARNGPVRPSVATSKLKLWSFGDLLLLRSVYWLRHAKVVDEHSVAASPMEQIRTALREAAAGDRKLWALAADGRPQLRLLVDASGRLYHVAEPISAVGGQGLVGSRDELDLLGPFVVDEASGPDLVRPRERLRIVPGKCGGEPHLVGTRLETRTLFALAMRGLDVEEIHRMYPDDDPVAMAEAVEFEGDLSPRLDVVAA